MHGAYGFGTSVDLRHQLSVLECISPWNKQGMTLLKASGLRAAEFGSYCCVD